MLCCSQSTTNVAPWKKHAECEVQKARGVNKPFRDPNGILDVTPHAELLHQSVTPMFMLFVTLLIHKHSEIPSSHLFSFHLFSPPLRSKRPALHMCSDCALRAVCSFRLWILLQCGEEVLSDRRAVRSAVRLRHSTAESDGLQFTVHKK